MIATMILLINFAMANKTVSCDGFSCSAVGGSVSVTDVSLGKKVTFDNRIDGDPNLEVVSGTNFDKSLVLVEGRNSSNSADLKVQMPSRFDRTTYGSNNAPNAPNIIALFDTINNLTFDLSGNIGESGASADEICYKKAASGEFDTQYSTGSAIKDAILNRRNSSHVSYDSAAPSNKCDSTDVANLKAVLTPASGAVICPAGYKTSDGWENTFTMKHIKPKRYCAPEGLPYEVRRCRISSSLFYCGHAQVKDAPPTDADFGLCNTKDSGGNCTSWKKQSSGEEKVNGAYNLIAKNAYGGDYVAGDWLPWRGDPSFLKDLHIIYSDNPFVNLPTSATPGINPYGATTGYQRTYIKADILKVNYCTSSTSCVKSDFTFWSSDHGAAQALCKTTEMPAGSYPKSNIVDSGGGIGKNATWNGSGYDIVYSKSRVSPTPGIGQFFALKHVDSLKEMYYETELENQLCTDPALISKNLEVNGYGSGKPWPGPYRIEEISIIPGSEAQMVSLDQSCPSGTRQYGVLRNHDACGQGDSICKDLDDVESINCNLGSCLDGMLFSTNKTFQGLRLEIDGGEKGSRHGLGNVFAFNFTGTLAVLSQKGQDGAHGVNNMVISTENKTCSKIEDEDFWKSGPKTDPNASYRTAPVLVLEKILFSPISVKPSTQAITEYRETSSVDVKVFTHVDFNIRKILLKESQ